MDLQYADFKSSPAGCVFINFKIEQSESSNTVHGQDAHLVTLVDRKSRLTLIGKVPDKKAATVAKEMIRLMKPVPGSRTITLDNGCEFAQHGKVSKKCGVNVYFAKP